MASGCSAQAFVLEPGTYVEIGVETGQSMALANAQTLCVGIDPEPVISSELPPRCEIFSQTSDAFFEQYDVKELLEQHAPPTQGLPEDKIGYVPVMLSTQAK